MAQIWSGSRKKRIDLRYIRYRAILLYEFYSLYSLEIEIEIEMSDFVKMVIHYLVIIL